MQILTHTSMHKLDRHTCHTCFIDIVQPFARICNELLEDVVGRVIIVQAMCRTSHAFNNETLQCIHVHMQFTAYMHIHESRGGCALAQ